MTPAVAPAEAAVAPPPPPAAAAAPPTPTTSGLAAELGAAVRSRSTGISPPQLQQPKGTATNSKWAQYAAPGAAARPKRQLRRVSAGETLSAAVLGTSRLRLLLAALLAVLLASRWDAAAVAKAGAGHGSQPAAPAAAAVSASARPWTELGARWQGLVQQARSAVSSLPSLGRVVKEHEEAQRQPQLLAGLARKVKAQVAAAAASPAGRQAAAAAQLLHSRLSEAAASPACRQAAAAVQALRAQAAAAAGSPAGQAAAAVAQAVRAKLVAAAASPAAQQAKAGLARLVGLPQLLHARLEALAAVPAVQAALDTAARLPPLAAVALLSLSLIGAAAAALAAAPSLVHSTVSEVAVADPAGSLEAWGSPAGRPAACRLQHLCASSSQWPPLPRWF